MTDYDKRHGGPFDRGSADYYYHRMPEPHYFVGGSYMTEKVETHDMSEDEIEAYHAGYAEARELGDRKEW